MIARYRFRSVWWLLLLAGLAVAVLLLVRRHFHQRFQDLLRRMTHEQAMVIELGQEHRGLFSSTWRSSKLRFTAAPTITATIDELVMGPSIWGNPDLMIDRMHFSIAGEPTEIFENLRRLPTIERAHWTLKQVSAEYAHRIFGRLLIEDLDIDRHDDSIRAKAGHVTLGTAKWDQVECSIHKRNEMIEVVIGDRTDAPTGIELGYFPRGRAGASQWSLTIRHQPARALGQRLGWDPGSPFDDTRVVGSLNFVDRQDRSQPIRGSVQMALDRWPKPDWPEVDALLGNAASFSASIRPSDDLSHWDLFNVDFSSLLFSMRGTGQVTFGAKPSVMFDVTGTRTCAQVQGNLPPSTYLDRATGYLEGTESTAPSGPSSKRRLEQVSLRLQLLEEHFAEGRRNLAWRLQAGCGLPGLESNSFVPMQLPAVAVPP